MLTAGELSARLADVPPDVPVYVRADPAPARDGPPPRRATLPRWGTILAAPYVSGAVILLVEPQPD